VKIGEKKTVVVTSLVNRSVRAPPRVMTYDPTWGGERLSYDAWRGVFMLLG